MTEYLDCLKALIKKRTLPNDLLQYVGCLRKDLKEQNIDDIPLQATTTINNHYDKQFNNYGNIEKVNYDYNSTSSHQQRSSPPLTIQQPQQQLEEDKDEEDDDEQQQEQQNLVEQLKVREATGVVSPPQHQQQQEGENTESTEDIISNTVDVDVKICEHEDPRKLLFSWAYLCEADDENKINNLLDINQNNLAKILAPHTKSEAAAGTIPLDKIFNAEAAKLLKTYRQLNDKEDHLFLRLLLSQTVTTMAPPMVRRSKALLGKDVYDDLVTRSLNRFNLDHKPLENSTEKVLDQLL